MTTFLFPSPSNCHSINIFVQVVVRQVPGLNSTNSWGRNQLLGLVGRGHQWRGNHCFISPTQWIQKICRKRNRGVIDEIHRTKKSHHNCK